MHRLVFCVQINDSQVEISRKLNASHGKSSQVGGQTRHKQAEAKTCDDLRSRLIRA